MRNAIRPIGTTFLTLVLLLGLAATARAEHINSLVVGGYTSGYSYSISFNRGSAKTVSTAELQIELNNFQDVIGYCVDLSQSFSYNTTYTSYDMYPITQSLATLQAGWLMQQYAPGLGYAHAGYSTAASITALQLAIWEVTYDTLTTYDTTGSYTAFDGGNFIAYNLANQTENATVRSLALSYLASIPNQLTQLALSNLDYSGVARSAYKQDFVVGSVGGNEVPEPGSMLLFGSAAGLLGWLRRRRAQNQGESASEA